jgi:hypothetical protein
MVTLLSKQTINTKEGPTPIMHKHKLKCLKDAPSFESGKEGEYWIAEYDNGRFCVFTASFILVDQYHVFNSEQELHEHFEEL